MTVNSAREATVARFIEEDRTARLVLAPQLSEWVPRVEGAALPHLAAHGLGGEATVAQVVAVPGLAERVAQSAVLAMRIERITEPRPPSSGVRQLGQDFRLHSDEYQSWTCSTDPLEPCETDDGPEGGSTCTSAEQATLDEAMDRLLAHSDRLPTSVAHENYRAWIEKNARTVRMECETRCAGGGSCYATARAGRVDLADPFFDRDLTMDLVGPTRLRASVLAHELVHVKDREDGKDSSNVLPKCGLDGCTEGGEYRGAYVQARWLDLGACPSEAFGCSYYRSYCGQDSLKNAIVALEDALACAAESLSFLEWAALVARAFVDPLGVLEVLGVILAYDLVVMVLSFILGLI